MFGAIKRLFKKGSDEELPSSPPPVPGTEVVPLPPPVTTAPVNQQTPQESAPPAPKATADASGESISLPFELIIPAVPKQLIKKVDPRAVAKHSLTLRVAVVLEQLSTGCLKVPLSALRASGPNGLFVTGQDFQMVNLPLKEVLTSLPNDFLVRRAQRVVPIPTDIADVFGPAAQGAPVRFLDKSELAPTQDTGTPGPSGATVPGPKIERPKETAPAAVAPPNTNPPAALKPKPLKKEGPSSATQFINKKEAATSATASSIPAPSFNFAQPMDGETLAIPLAQLLDEWPEAVRLEIAYQNLTDTSCLLPVVDVIEGLKRRKLQYPWKTVRGWIDAKLSSGPSAHGDTLLDLPVKSVMSRFFAYQANKAPEKPVEPALVPNAPAPKPSQPVPVFSFDGPAEPDSSLETQSPAASGEALSVPVEKLAVNWPAEILDEIKRPGQAKVHLPLAEIEAGLRQGKVSFAWNKLRMWIEPVLSPATSHGETTLDLPLSVLAPMFLEKRGKVTSGRKTELPADIPDVFEGGGDAEKLAVAAPVEPGAQAAQPVQARQKAAPAAGKPAPVQVASAPESSADPSVPAPKKKPGGNIAEIFGQPGKKNWTPNEIVHHTNLLPNVAGSMIALQDGLLVAGCMPPTWKTETLAAFLPQIFGRLRQYSKDLEMGELVSVSFGVQQGTLEIFNAGIIYFAALSRPGESLPLQELTTIARELSRHTK